MTDVGRGTVTPVDAGVIARQLGRPLRGEVSVAHRCRCGQPDVVATAPRLDDGTPFPTTFYLTCPRLTAAVSGLESAGAMAEFQEWLEADAEVAQRYREAHETYLAARARLGDVPEIAGVSAGGMPGRVKCLHALVAHSLAVSRGVNPIGDAALDRLAVAGHVACVPRVVAGIDCGTNSLRLLVAEVVTGDDGAVTGLRDVVREMRVVRLGEGLEESGAISQAALARAFSVCEDYGAMMREAQVSAVRFVATSASRDAENSEEFISGVVSRLGVRPEVISGGEEARLSFIGATATPEVASAASPRLVVDIGGGSTEFVLGEAEPRQSVSVALGCVRFAERHLRSDPPTQSELEAVAADADTAIARAGEVVPLGQAASLVGLAGTVTTVAALAMDLDAYDPARIHGARISADDVHAVAERLGRMTLAQRRALAVMHPGRADVIVAGAIILSRIVAATGVDDVVVSEHDILDGIAADVAAGAGAAFFD